jgi:type II secretory pathway pseudopilin PulG
MNIAHPTRRVKPSLAKRSEDGYILVAVMFMLAILIIAMSVAAPSVAKAIQRDRELETMHRGKQFARAVKLYYKQFGAYPPNIDALVKTNEIRFLRKKYIDPTTGKDEWKIIRVGQNKAPSAMGFFGVPLGGAGMGGGLCGNALPSSTGSSSPSTFGSSSGFSSGGSSFGSSSPSGPTAGCPSTTNSSSTGSGSTTDPGTAAGSTDPNAAGGSSTPGTATGAIGTTTSSNTGPASGGQTLGGVGIMGFSPNSPKQSILMYKKKNHYNEWEFVYDPLADQMAMQGGNAGNNGLNGNPAGTTPFGGSPTGTTFGPSSNGPVPNNPNFPGSPAGGTTGSPSAPQQ